MRQVLLFLILNSLIYNLQAQILHIYDAETRKPVPFAVVAIKDKALGAAADSAGTVQLKQFPAAHDTLIISALNYETLLLPAATLSPSLFLQPTQYELPAVLVHPSKNILIGSKQKRGKSSLTRGITSPPGYQQALLMPNDNKYTGIIESVGIYIKEQHEQASPFRIRIYAADGPDNSPGTDLLRENLLHTPLNQDHWFTFDVSGFHIPFPEAGIYVAVEWLKIKTETEPDGKGVAIGGTKEFKEERSWVYNLNHQNWKKLPTSTGKQVFNLMMRATILVDN